MPTHTWNYWIDPIVFPFVLPITQIALTGSVYSVVAVALERYFNVCRPFSRNLGSVCDGFGYVTTIIIFSILYNGIKFFEFRTDYPKCIDMLSPEECDLIRGGSTNTNTSFSIATVEYTELRTNSVYSTVNLITNTAVVGVIPILVLSFLNFKIIKTMKRNTVNHNKICSQERRDQVQKDRKRDIERGR